MAVCDTDQKEITIDETYCWSVDQLGRPIDIYSDVDYRMQVGPGKSDVFETLPPVCAVRGLLERELEILPDNIRPAGCLHKV